MKNTCNWSAMQHFHCPEESGEESGLWLGIPHASLNCCLQELISCLSWPATEQLRSGYVWLLVKCMGDFELTEMHADFNSMLQRESCVERCNRSFDSPGFLSVHQNAGFGPNVPNRECRYAFARPLWVERRYWTDGLLSPSVDQPTHLITRFSGVWCEIHPIQMVFIFYFYIKTSAWKSEMNVTESDSHALLKTDIFSPASSLNWRKVYNLIRWLKGENVFKICFFPIKIPFL